MAADYLAAAPFRPLSTSTIERMQVVMVRMKTVTFELRLAKAIY